MIYREHTTYLQKCFACGRVGQDMYRTTVKGQQYLVCSSDHAIKLEEEANRKEELPGGPEAD